MASFPYLDKEGKDAADRPRQGWFEAAGLAAQGSFSHHPALDFVSGHPSSDEERNGEAWTRRGKTRPTDRGRGGLKLRG